MPTVKISPFRIITNLIKYFLYVAVAFIVLDAGLIIRFARYRPTIPKTDAIIVLGAAINTPALYNRTRTGLDLYEQGKADTIVLSGGRISDKDISEAGYMQRVIRQNSDPVPRLIIEDQSHSTYENLKNSRGKLPGPRSVIIVSDAFHLARSVLLARRLGFKKVYWDAPASSYYGQAELIRYYLREIIAMIGYIPRFIFG